MELSPDSIQYLDEQVARGVFGSRTEALDEAVHLLRERRALHETLESIDGLEEMLVEGRRGPYREMKDEDWENLEEGIRNRAASRNRNS